MPREPELRQEFLDGFFALIADDYDSLVDAARNVHNIRSLFGKLNELIEIGPDTVVIDYGCGTGLFLRALPSLAKQVVGVESCPAMRDIAGKNGMRVLSVDDLALEPEGSVAGALASYVFHFDPDPHGLHLLWSRLRPGGTVVANFHKGNCVDHISAILSAKGGLVRKLPSVGHPYDHGPYLAFTKK